MLEIFEDYLFAQGYFAADEFATGEDQAETVVASLIALWNYARIRIIAHPELANSRMISVAQRNLGFKVPLPFYRDFPDSVLGLSYNERLADQLMHYYRTYCLGDFSHAGRSMLEARYERLAFAEDVEPKKLAIITPAEADELLKSAVEGFLSSTRPLNAKDQELVEAYVTSNPAFPVVHCACKDTAIRLILNTRDLSFMRYIELADAIRLVEWMHELRYTEMKLVHAEYHKGLSILEYEPVSAMKKLNLRNRDRKLIAAVIDKCFERGNVDIDACLEKKRLWNGLLHHLHYRPKSSQAQEFCDAMRGKDRRSAYSAMERCLAAGDVRGATDALLQAKGPGAVLRHLDHLLSRIDDTRDTTQVEADIDYVLTACNTRNRVILVQLLLKYGTESAGFGSARERDFAFVHLGQLTKHHETREEVSRRKSDLPDRFAEHVEKWVRGQFERACRDSLGNVYVADGMRYFAVPLQEGASMGGFGTLPRSTRIPLPGGKKIRAFTYWEKVNDIDLSCFALGTHCDMREFSWRTMAKLQSRALVYSGDQTSGYHGGSEYFDVDTATFAHEYGSSWRYLVFCDNVYSSKTFDQCVCRAGYMLRDLKDSGEVFEPATVQSSFEVNCKSRAAYLFALDLKDPAFIWLNLGERSMRHIAGTGDFAFLFRYLCTTDILSVHDFAAMLASEVVSTPEEADVVFADASPEELGLHEGQELIRPSNTARFLELLNA
ncbi:MAG: hypothetical protein IKG18_18780 [Atopobiaceae bacterium]|nr:hypothetical protein [Atopobiaceae bacterium]